MGTSGCGAESLRKLGDRKEPGCLLTFSMNSLRDPILKAFLGQKSPWASTPSSSSPFLWKQCQDSSRDSGSVKIYLTARAFSLLIHPCSCQSMGIQAWETRKEGVGWVQL